MRVRLNRTHFPVLTLGYGRRIGLWVQGCRIGCAGCCARDTWSTEGGSLLEVEALFEWCRSVAEEQCDGITISGGEPFEQPEALGTLLDMLRAWRTGRTVPFDILCYSGLPLRRLLRDHGGLLDRLDALIPEPFSLRHDTDLPWRGSGNQPLVALSDLGRARYAAEYRDEPALPKRLQLLVQGGRVECIGIPGRGDFERLEAVARSRGVLLGDVSWRA